MHTNMYTREYTYVCIHACTHTYIDVYTNIHVCVHTYADVHIHVYSSTHKPRTCVQYIICTHEVICLCNVSFADDNSLVARLISVKTMSRIISFG